jgi:hypothetical protein
MTVYGMNCPNSECTQENPLKKKAWGKHKYGEEASKKNANI